MIAKLTEAEVHEHLYRVGLEAVVLDDPRFDGESGSGQIDDGCDGFALWRLIRSRAFAKINRLHSTIRYGEFVGGKVQLPIDNTKPMELDLLGQYEEGLFVLELKIDRAAERNAFSELFAYSNYIAGMFALSGRQDIANVLVARMDAKITRQAYLYDLLIADRDVIVYLPEFPDGTAESLRLRLYAPADEDFKRFGNQILSHDAMSCVVASFDVLPGWFDSEEENSSLNAWTREHLELLGSYAAQLMEAQQIHGFCFVRKPWKEVPAFYRNSLFLCALNPFLVADHNRADVLTAQLNEECRSSFLDGADSGFASRLIGIAQRAVNDCFTHDHRSEVEMPLWSSVFASSAELVLVHNLAFRPTGLMREAYVSYLNWAYAREAIGRGTGEDFSRLKVDEITNWLQAWVFLERSGLSELHRE